MISVSSLHSPVSLLLFYDLRTSVSFHPFYNIGTGEEISIKDLAFMIKDIVGFQGDLHFDISMPDGTMRKLLDINRMAELGWTSKLSLEDGINKTVQTKFGENI
jgi:nucleoside-diphosphate-sugar epimerase|tara:strand:+ start:68 stop:379 length:312 start_codon:yes stop_codon:yes gene_type:complete